jgi:hypothetical protein
MAIKLKVNTGRKNRNRKEIFFSWEELQLLHFAQKYYSVDLTSTIRILLRSSIIQLVAKQRRDGVPRLTAEMEKLLSDCGL